jgi:hypothetical protein
LDEAAGEKRPNLVIGSLLGKSVDSLGLNLGLDWPPDIDPLVDQLDVNRLDGHETTLSRHLDSN